MKSIKTIAVVFFTIVLGVLLLLFEKKMLFEIEYLFPPPPGWRSFVAEALLEENSFPHEWEHYIDSPANLYNDVEINHVYRGWGKVNTSGTAEEAIWRAYSRIQAKDFYDQLLRSKLYFQKKPEELIIDFSVPEEIFFLSKTADEYYLTCGWYTEAYCDYFGRYRNYVIYLHLELEKIEGGHHSDGLTYEEIEQVLDKADGKMTNYLKANSIIP